MVPVSVSEKFFAPQQWSLNGFAIFRISDDRFGVISHVVKDEKNLAFVSKPQSHTTVTICYPLSTSKCMEKHELQLRPISMEIR